MAKFSGEEFFMRKMSLGIPQGKCPVLVKCTEVVWFGEMFFSEGGGISREKC